MLILDVNMSLCRKRLGRGMLVQNWDSLIARRREWVVSSPNEQVSSLFSPINGRIPSIERLSVVIFTLFTDKVLHLQI
jgi:hypothetical protein